MDEAINLVENFKVEKVIFNCGEFNELEQDLIKINQNETIGIIICKQDNNYVIKYCSDERIITREYELV